MLALLLIFLVIVLRLNLNKRLICSTGNDGTKNIEIMVLLKHLSIFWRTLETPLINCEINYILTWFVNCVISNAANN